jgi:hypothetical protein
MRKVILVLVLNLTIISSFAQQLTQTIRGVVVDKISQVPLPGVNVILLGSEPLKGTTTDIDGQFRLSGVAVGKQTLKMIFLGYEEQVLSNLVVNSGKELVLQISMEEKVIQGKEITVTANREKNIPMNDMAVVSARTFSVEETQKYAAAINDPARMASSFAGVVSADDGNNNISIRGNAPNTLQWRMEGVEIPNPNHFSAPGTAGGGISILSSQLLYNSDFLTGAFPAEYGNALSGVFDLRLRKGNNEKQEFTVQSGFLGLDAAVEGPFSKKYQGSYLINYRYSTLAAIGKMINLGDALTLFQDLSFNVYLPTKKFGSFGVFGFGGLSSQKYDAKKDSLKWEDEGARYGNIFKSSTGAVGITNAYLIGQNTYVKTALVASKKEVSDLTTRLSDELSKEIRFDGLAVENKITLTSTLNHKFNSQHSVRTGFMINKIGYNIQYNDFDNDVKQLVQTINTTSSSYSSQLFGAYTYKVTSRLTLQGGLHYINFFYNNTSSLEERASVRYAINKKQSISFGYGRHSQLQPIGVYFANYTNEAGEKVYPNKNLDLSKSLHYVLSYDRMLTQQTHLKLEFYYQDLYSIPISTDSTKTYSMVNESGSFVTDPLVNKGVGRNIGSELTLEQYLYNDFYYLLSASLYNSEYKALDNKWRNTRYNGNYALTFTSGKEFKTGERFKKRILGVNIKVVYTGGFRATPINFEESLAKGETVYYEKQAFTQQNPSYFRTDLRVSLKRNRPNSTHTISLDIQNATNRKNIFGDFFDPQTGKIKTYYQTPLIPVFNYKIEF